MRKLIMSVLILSIGLWIVPVFAGEKVELVHWHLQQKMKEGVTEEDLANEFMRLHPNVKLLLEEIPSGQMRDKTMIALMAGTPPNIERDYLGRLGTWHYEDALVSLNDVIVQEDLDDIYPDVLASFTMDGQLIGYPTTFWLQGYGVNKNILDKAGAAVPSDDFTLAEFDEIANKVKAVGYWATVFFASGEQGDYWTLQNLQAYGAKLWENGDYKNTVINSPEGVKALERMVALEENGYAAKGTAGRAVKTMLTMIESGKVGMFAIFPRAADLANRQANLEKGIVDELQDIIMVGTPHAVGTPSPSLPFGPTAVVVFKHKDSEKVRLSIEWLKFITSQENISFDAIGQIQFCSRISVNPHAGNLPFDTQLRLVAANGAYDLGIPSPHYGKARQLFFPEIQAAFMGRKTAQEALDDFADAVARLCK